jgi:hypothetical protein
VNWVCLAITNFPSPNWDLLMSKPPFSLGTKIKKTWSFCFCFAVSANNESLRKTADASNPRLMSECTCSLISNISNEKIMIYSYIKHSWKTWTLSSDSDAKECNTLSLCLSQRACYFPHLKCWQFHGVPCIFRTFTQNVTET